MGAGDRRRLRPEDLVDLEEVAAGLEDASGEGAVAIRRQVRAEASRAGIDLGEDPARVLAVVLGVSGPEPGARRGQRLVRAYAWLRAGFFVLGLVLGGVGTAGVLVIHGTLPVNVMNFLRWLVAPQWVLLVLLVVGLLLGRRLETIVPFLGALRAHVSRIRHGLAARLAGGGAPPDAEASARAARGEESLYAGVDRWRSSALLQWLAIGFNAGIVITFVGRLAVTDVVFGWSTSLDGMTRLFPDLVRGIAAPWAAWLPSAVPDPAMVEATRYVRIGGGDVAWAGGAAHPDALLFSGWWPFLVATVIVYGLAPRFVLLAACNVMIGIRLRSAVKQSRRLARLRERISAPLVEVRTETTGDPATPGSDDTPAVRRDGAPRNEAPGDLGRCSLVLWGDVPDPGPPLDRALDVRLGARPERRIAAGGLDFSRTEQAAATLCDGGLARLPVVLVAEAYEAPAEALERFVAFLRAGGHPARVVVVALVDVLEADGWTEARPEDLAMWKRGLDGLAAAGAHLLGPVPLPAEGGDR